MRWDRRWAEGLGAEGLGAEFDGRSISHLDQPGQWNGTTLKMAQMLHDMIEMELREASAPARLNDNPPLANFEDLFCQPLVRDFDEDLDEEDRKVTHQCNRMERIVAVWSLSEDQRSSNLALGVCFPLTWEKAHLCRFVMAFCCCWISEGHHCLYIGYVHQIAILFARKSKS